MFNKFNIFNKKQKQTASCPSNGKELIISPQDEKEGAVEPKPTAYSDNSQELAEVVVEPISKDVFESNLHLQEIKDPFLVSQIDSVIPSAIRMGSKFVSHKANSETLYKVILRKGGKLADSKTVRGAKRAFSIGENGITEQANLVEVNPLHEKSVLNASKDIFNVASLVVGQYYMSQIDSKMETLSNELQDLHSFFENEYRGKVVSLIESVYNSSKFRMEIVSNDELRKQEINNVQSFRKDCLDLLCEAETSIDSILMKKNLNYQNYLSEIKKLSEWKNYQEILLTALAEINELDFALNLGAKSKECCYGSFEKHRKKQEEGYIESLSWKEEQNKRLGIEMDRKRRKYQTSFAKLLEKPIGAIKQEWTYRPLEEEAVVLLKKQDEKPKEIGFVRDNSFSKDIEIVIKGDKKYYLAK